MATPPIGPIIAQIVPQEGIGTPIAARCTIPQVLNTNAKTAQNDPDDPQSIWLGDHANDANVIAVQNPGLPYLQLALAVSGSTPPTTFPKLRVFGSTPIDLAQLQSQSAPLNPRDNQRYELARFDSTNYDQLGAATMNRADDRQPRLWLPCYDPLRSSASIAADEVPSPLHDFAGGVIDCNKNATTGGDKQLVIYHNNHYAYVAGMHDIMVVVDTAGDAATAIAVIGWFSG